MSACSASQSQPASPPVLGSAAIRLVLIDDHLVFLDGLSESLTRQADLTVVAVGSNGADALSLWARHRPDVLVLDMQMSGDDGIVTLRRLLAAHPQARVLLLTSSDDPRDSLAALDAGAAGYITKHARYDELVGAIREVHAGGRPIGEAVARMLAVRDRAKPLTPRELEVLGLLSEGLSYREIGRALDVTERTARAHAVAVKEKLQASNAAHAVAIGFQRGLIGPRGPGAARSPGTP
ncbi:MAG: response regulator transcription factor [Planctomycetota bacterium]